VSGSLKKAVELSLGLFSRTGGLPCLSHMTSHGRSIGNFYSFLKGRLSRGMILTLGRGPDSVVSIQFTDLKYVHSVKAPSS